MLWRRKSDGFDWHKHVRTTIKLRREARKQKLDDAVELAMGGIKGAGRAGVSAGVSSLDTMNRAIAAPFVWFGRAIATVLTAISNGMATAMSPLGTITEGRGRASIMGLVAVIAGLLGFGRAQVEGWDVVSVILCALSAVLLIVLLGPPIFAGRGPAALTAISARIGTFWQRLPGLSEVSVPVQRGLTASVLLVSAVAAGWFGARMLGSLTASTVGSIPGLSRPAIEGVPLVLAGDSLRINGQVIKLAGIEAPEADQQCGGQGREARWRCGEQARNQLRDLVRNKQVRCEVSGAGSAVATGTCKMGATDIAAELVTRGHVFSQQGLFSSYGRLEQDARNAKKGVWKGAAERPDEYRARLWETAKKSSPQGCPIKGQISRNDRTYLVPWQAGYAKVRIRPDKGERWFCSEQEAQAAGWRKMGGA